MKKFENLTEHDIFEAAWSYYLMRYTNELEHAENAEKILGRKSEIAEARVKKYKAKEQELRDYLLKLENSK